MFTGIIEQTATLTGIIKTEFGVRLTISCEGWAERVSLGESICTSGCCLTVAETSGELGQTSISFDVVHETLRCTTMGDLSVGDTVNLERSLRGDSFLGGHYVQGHVDAVEKILDLIDADSRDNRIRITTDGVDPDVIVPKGSITIEGVSLTIAQVDVDWLEVAIIPTTQHVTTLGSLSKGDRVNVETDIIARTIAHVVRRMG